MIEHVYSDNLLSFSLLPQIKGKAFWLDADYTEPGIGEERTKANGERKDWYMVIWWLDKSSVT